MGAFEDETSGTIYSTGYRGHSVFRAIEREATVLKAPLHGLDTGAIEQYNLSVEKKLGDVRVTRKLSNSEWALQVRNGRGAV